ncbi:NDxxF motif lipoprotein [Lysinibacillus sp. Bpr_S20]|uniref:NDxxF motif lipoprotein n=1 Tax=Lysinibacillus sp. Bpr_S20 TaxID=2933964 RepID=UPI0020114FD4|nr:NDxxF motif lipoprotein [Lysinibacillus sp. Bpr_S20]MCL1699488.1 NDxxF motif lipoprotein [Lysinibacillus sp. Bpr_S20]
MKRFTFYVLMAFTIVLMCACSNDTLSNEASDEASNKESKGNAVSNVSAKIPDDLFVSTKKNETITEDEMKASIKKYMDYSHVIDKEMETIVYEYEDATESDRETLNKLIDEGKKNDTNFNDFISNNSIPDDYKEPSKTIYEFVSSIRATLTQFDEEIVGAVENGSLTEITDFASEHFSKANGRQQLKIEKFLDEKKIKTTYFDE